MSRLRGTIKAFSERTADLIQQEVPAYAGPVEGRRRHLIVLALTSAATAFVESLGPNPPSRSGLDDLYRRMGYGEANDGRDLNDLAAALRIGHIEGIELVRAATERGDLSLHYLPVVWAELSDFVAELTRQVTLGARLYWEAQVNDPVSARRALLHDLCRGELERLDLLADHGHWCVPDLAVLIGVQLLPGVRWPPDSLLTDALIDKETRPALLLVGTEHLDSVLEVLHRWQPTASLVHTWPITMGAVPDARRWVERAVHLVERGVIPRRPVIDCARYYTALWLHAEPALRAHLAQNHLAPLLAEGANTRDILTSTLLVWLRTRESAPNIAAALGVHPQTVRYRWRKLNEMFGERLDDPAFQVQLTMILEATLPLWMSGDESDFRRFRTEARLRSLK